MNKNGWKIGALVLGGLLLLTAGFLLARMLGNESSSPAPSNKNSIDNKIEESQLSGEVFIATRGGQNFKLGLVDVFPIPIDSFNTILEARKLDIKEQIGQRESACDKCGLILKQIQNSSRGADLAELENCQIALEKCVELPDILWSLIPGDSKKTTTNADGAFSVNLPKGQKYVVLAKGRRLIGDKTERYFWMQEADLSKGSAKLVLSNSNLLEPDAFKLVYGYMAK